MTVLVTDAQYRMALAVIRELGEDGMTVAAAAPKGGDPPAFRSKHVKYRFRLPEPDGDGYAEALLDACRGMPEDADGPPVIFPVGALTLQALARRTDLFKGAARLLLPDAEALGAANDKAYVLSLAESLGVPVPRSFGTSLERALESASFPAVVKFRNGEALGLHAAQRYRVVADGNGLRKEYLRMSALQANPVVQEYVEGHGFGVSCVFDRQSRPVSVICHRRVREYPVEGGPSACCESAWDPSLVDYAVRLLQALGWRGIAMAEFRGREGNFKLMEINPRVWGSFALTRAVKSGFARAYCLACAGRALPVYGHPAYPLGKRMNYLFSDGAAAAGFFKKGDLKNGFRAVSDLMNPFVRDGVLEWRDPRASAAYLAGVLRKARKTGG